MNPIVSLLFRWRMVYAAFFALLARRWKKRFYLHLAVLFTLFALADAAYFHLREEMRQAAFDSMASGKPRRSASSR